MTIRNSSLMTSIVLALMMWLGASAVALADEQFARDRIQEMSDYLTELQTFSFSYNAVFEIVTTEDQKIQLASSGSAVVERPNRIRATRQGGFVNMELIYDGETVTLVGHDMNVFAKIELPGSLTTMVDGLRDKYGFLLPAADLLLPDLYNELMWDVNDVKDIGSGVVNGVECDTFAFRTPDLDWQIWIAQGDFPYPCRYVITTTNMGANPQYSIDVSDWQTDAEVISPGFSFANATGAQEIGIEELNISELPQNFTKGAAQ